MNFRKRIDNNDGVWHFSPKCQLWPQSDYREANEPPSLAFERLCAECLKLEPGVSEEEIKRSIR
jgi:hypothetical protein